MIGAGFVAAALRNGFGAFHHECAAGWADRAGWFCFYGIFTFWVSGTAVEDTETAVTADHLAVFTGWAGDAGFFAAVAVLVFLDVFALGVFATCDKFSKSSVTLDEFSVFTLGAGLPGLFRAFAFGAVE